MIATIVIITIGIILNFIIMKYITGSLYSENKMRGRQGITGSKGLHGLYGIPGEIGPRGPRGESGPQGELGEKGNIGNQGIIYKYSNISDSDSNNWWEENRETRDSSNNNRFYNMQNTQKITKIKPCVQCPGWDPLPHWSITGYCSDSNNCILNR